MQGCRKSMILVGAWVTRLKTVIFDCGSGDPNEDQWAKKTEPFPSVAVARESSRIIIQPVNKTDNMVESINLMFCCENTGPVFPMFFLSTSFYLASSWSEVKWPSLPNSLPNSLPTGSFPNNRLLQPLVFPPNINHFRHKSWPMFDTLQKSIGWRSLYM